MLEMFRRRSLRLTLGLAVLAVGLSACSDGPGDEGDLVIALTRDDTFTTAQAECIASAVFAEYGEDEEALGRISGAESYEELTGTDGVDGVDGFDEFFTRAVSACTNT